MGALYAGTCFDTASSAARAYFADVPPAMAPGASSFVSYVVEDGPDTWVMLTVNDGTTVGVVELGAPVFPDCSPVDAVLDGMVLGWLVVGVWAAAWLIAMLRKSWS